MNQSHITHQWRSRVRCSRRFITVALLLASVGGCQKTLFDADDPRTQFEVHDRMRQRYIPLEEEDVFGNPQPALRARLSPDA